MTYVINEDVAKKKGMDIPTLLAIMLVKTGVNITVLFKELEKKEVLVKDLFHNEYFVTQRWDDVACNILLSGDEEVPKEDNIEKLAVQLMEIFPKGKKEGTSHYWRGNKKEIKERLQKFYKLYNNKYTDEEIIQATKSYVASFNGSYSYMRILKYFILKNEKKVDSEGVNYIEEVSELATYIENAGQEEALSGNWINELR